MTVLADPSGPLEDTVPARRPITLRHLLTYTLGSGMTVGAASETAPISEALGAIYSPPLGGVPPSPDEWMRRLGALPLVYQPGERWMYDLAANVTVVLVARATGKSFGEALRERICEPLGMKDTGFHVGGDSIGRLASAYARRGHRRGRGRGPPRRTLEPAAGVRIRWRGPRFDRGRLPGVRLGPARRRHSPRRAGALAAVGDTDNERPADAGAEGGLRVLAGVLRGHRLGLRDGGPHPPHAPPTLGRELRVVRLLRHRLVQRPRRGHDDDLHDGSERTEATRRCRCGSGLLCIRRSTTDRGA